MVPKIPREMPSQRNRLDLSLPISGGAAPSGSFLEMQSQDSCPYTRDLSMHERTKAGMTTGRIGD